MVTSLLQHLPVCLPTHLPGHWLALLVVDKVLQFLGLGLLLHHTLLDWLTVTLLVVDRMGLKEYQGLTDLLHMGVAFLLIDSSGDVLAVLGWPLLAVLLVFLSLFTVQFLRETTFCVLYNLLLLRALTALYVFTVLCLFLAHLHIIDDVTYLYVFSETFLDKKSLFNNLNVDLLYQLTVYILYSEALLVRDKLYYSSAVGSRNIFALLFYLCETGTLHVRLTVVLMDHSLNLLTLWMIVIPMILSMIAGNIASKY